ncbi:MAG TPA: pantoate--beta-alanine ligase [Acidobacteriaceae bacterium]
MNRPELITSVAGMQEASRKTRGRGTIGLVPTMGALHEGHLSLVRAAREICDSVVVSIFVNPAQFGPHEDFERYPRALQSDVDQLEREGVASVFAPSVEEMYPDGESTFIEVSGVGDRLDGRSRPGHFRGVATVVAKLFNIVMPDLAFFGQKDAAQVAVLRAMVRDLNFPLKLMICPTVRERDGLALSSRNRYLTDAQRAQARVLYRALLAAQTEAVGGARDAAELRGVMLHELEREPGVRIDYAEVVDPDTLLPVEDIGRGVLLAVAAWVGKTRLIDNLLLPEMRERS